MKLKICGMKEEKNIKSIATLDPDYMGFIFWKHSLRNISIKIPELKNKIKKTARDVGENFPAEARAMHYGEKEDKPIIGKTTLEEARDLAEEGIPFAPLPWNDDKVN